MRIWWERTTGVLVRGTQELDVVDRIGVQLVTHRRRSRVQRFFSLTFAPRGSLIQRQRGPASDCR